MYDCIIKSLQKPVASTLPQCYGSWLGKDSKHDVSTDANFVQLAEKPGKERGNFK